jgi:hypothetical protein
MSQGPSTTLLDFVLSLVDDPGRRQRFTEDPRALMAEAGLTQKQQEVLLSRDVLRIQHAIEYETDVDEGSLPIVMYLRPPPCGIVMATS